VAGLELEQAYTDHDNSERDYEVSISTNTDSNFLNWVADRFVHVYGEREGVDFVIKLRDLADKAAWREAQPEAVEQPKRATMGATRTAINLAKSNALERAAIELTVHAGQRYTAGEYVAQNAVLMAVDIVRDLKGKI
jgi:hypothetical protein